VAIAKSRTQEEQAVVNSRLRKKYPQMFTKEWKEAVTKANKKTVKKSQSTVKRVKQAQSEQRSSLESALTGDEIKRLIGR